MKNKKYLGIDVGGTTIKVGIVHHNKIIKKWVIETKINDLWGHLFANLKDLNLNEIDGIGISIPGFIDHQKGIVKLAGNLKLKDYDVQKALNPFIKNQKVAIINDANAATLAELVNLKQKNLTLIMYTIGTGIGGGLVINDELVYGKDGYAGEFGHGGFMQNDAPCTCGKDYCLEVLSSATGIEKLLSKTLNQKITIKEINQKFQDKDPEIISVFKKCLKPLVSHISIMENALNPNFIIIGGGVSMLGQPLIALINEMLDDCTLSFIRKSTTIKSASLGNDAGIIGAAHWVEKKHHST